MRTIVGISGKQRAGKDSLAEFLIRDQRLPGFRRLGLADALKQEVADNLGMTLMELEVLKNENPDYREILIKHGQSRRAEDPDYWAKKVVETHGDIIVPDVRFHNELSILHTWSDVFVSIRINATREERAKRGILSNEDDPSETSLDEYIHFDLIVENNSDLAELEQDSFMFANYTLGRMGVFITDRLVDNTQFGKSRWD